MVKTRQRSKIKEKKNNSNKKRKQSKNPNQSKNSSIKNTLIGNLKDKKNWGGPTHILNFSILDVVVVIVVVVIKIF